MAVKSYVGVSNVAEEVTKAYIGVNNVARKVNKIYAGVNGVAELVYNSGPQIVTWSGGTDAQIVAMVEAADAGLINLSDYWSVGDERTVSLSAMSATGVGESHAAQDVTFVLMHAGLYELTNAVESGRTTCSFVVGMKDCLNEAGYMNSTHTNAGSWSSSARRAWCNSTFKNALPSSLVGIFKQFNCVTGTWLKSSKPAGGPNITTQDYFALAAGKEVFGGGYLDSYSTDNEANALTQFTWYETSANRIKNRSGSANTWWERSPSYYFSDQFCYVVSGGSRNCTYAGNGSGLSVFGCI